MKMKILSILFLAILLLAFVSAQESLWNQTKNFLTDSVKPTITKTTKNTLGFGESFGRIFQDIIVGWIAGIILWVTYLLILWKRKIVDLNKRSKDEVEIRGSRTKWLNFVTGRTWKIVFIGIAFAVLMQIPLINSVLKVITLEYLDFSFLTRAIILAIVIGYLPATIEHFHKQMIINKLERKVNKARVAAVRAS